MKSEKVKIMKCVPFQLCPKCNGNGVITNYNLNTTSYLTTNVCDLCNGSMVIPMAVIPEKKNEQSKL